MKFIYLFLILIPIQLNAQLDTIESIVYYHKTKDGRWQKNKKYEYSYKKNRVVEIFSYWKNNDWKNHQKRIRENTPESDSISVKIYKNENSKWILDKMKIGLILKKYDKKIHYEVETVYFDERVKMKRREDKLGRKFTTSRFVKKGESYNLLKLLPTTQIGDMIRRSSKYFIKNGEKRKEFSPLRCGMSEPITFKLFYDNLNRIERFKSNKIEGFVNYKKTTDKKEKIQIVKDNIYKIYPNPIKETLYFDKQIDKSMNISIRSMNSEILYKSEIDRVGKTSIDLSYFPPGNYIFIVEIGDENYVEKIIKLGK